MPVVAMERMLDVGIRDFDTAECTVLHYGPPHEEHRIERDSKLYSIYAESGRVLRWYLGLIGETTPEPSQLSVDIANDPSYHVYRYDWVFGISLPPLGNLWWDWQSALRKGVPVTVQLVILPGDSGVCYTCVSTSLNVLPPSKDTDTWWDRNRAGVIEAVKSGSKAAEDIYPGSITKAVAALSNSLEAKGKWRSTNWFIYQFLDSDYQGCAVEWRISSKLLKQYGPLLRGSLVLAFHGGVTNEAAVSKSLRLVMRPQIGFSHRDDLSRVTPTSQLALEKQVQLQISPCIARDGRSIISCKTTSLQMT